MTTEVQDPTLDVIVARLRIGGKRLDTDIERALTDATIEMGIDTAATLTLTIRDRDRAIVRSGRLVEGLRATLLRTDVPGYDRFALASVEKNGDAITLVFEDETVFRLRNHRGFKKATRGQVTRSEFAYSLVRELTHPTVPFYSPEIYTKQPISWSDEVGRIDDEKTSVPKDDAGRPYGFSAREAVTVKGTRADEEQRRNIAEVLKVGVEIKVPKFGLVCAVAAMIVLTNARNKSPGGLFNMVPPQGGSATNIEQAARRFYLGPQQNLQGGAIELVARTRTTSVARVCLYVTKQGSTELYRKYDDEARKAVNLYLGSDRFDYRGSLKRIRTEKKAKYEFMRGDPNNPDVAEDSWTCLRRLAEEVKWRVFVFRGTVYFISDRELATKYPLVTITEDDPGVISLDYGYDVNEEIDEISIEAAAELWSAPPGSVVKIVGQGDVIDGKQWLVGSYSRSMFSRVADITLQAPEPPAPEPAPEIQTTQVNIESGKPLAAEQSEMRRKIVEIAKKQLPRAGRDIHYANTRPIPTTFRQSPVNTDCSGFVKMVYREAGAPDPNGTNFNGSAFTGTMWDAGKPVSKPQPGDLVFYDPVHAASGHVALVINDTECISHGSEGGPRRIRFNYRTPKGFRTYALPA